MNSLFQKLRPHVVPFTRYLISGVGAVLLDFGSYFVLVHLGVWFVTANTIGNILGFISAFFFHKYFSFQGKNNIMNHFTRYCLLNLFNFILQTGILWLMVETLHLNPDAAKILSWGMTVLWNFFLYRFLVYV